MPIQIIASDPSELPEPIRANAKEAGGKFVVEQLPEGWQPVAHMAPHLANQGKLTQAAADLKRAQDRLKQFAIDDKGTLPEPDVYREQLAEYARLKEAAGKQPNADELRKQLAADFEGRYTGKLTAAEKKALEAEKRAQDLDRDLDGAILNSTINEIIAEMRPKDGKAEIARMILQRDLGIDKVDGKRVVRVRGADGQSWQIATNTADGYASPKDYALNVIRSKHADMFQGEGSGGAGASNTGGTSRRNVVQISRSALNGKANEMQAIYERAKKEGRTVEFVD